MKNKYDGISRNPCCILHIFQDFFPETIWVVCQFSKAALNIQDFTSIPPVWSFFGIAHCKRLQNEVLLIIKTKQVEKAIGLPLKRHLAEILNQSTTLSEK